MIIDRLVLQEFRSYRSLVVDLPAAGLRLIGPNASGKSTVMEAVAMLATTRSPRTASERDVINWASGEEYGLPPFARIVASVERAHGRAEIEIGLQADPAKPGAVRKQIKLNGRPVRAMDAVGTLQAVLFSPEDVGIVSGPPAGRRRYLDLAVSQIDGPYLRALARFARVLTQRNSLLKSLGREGLPPGSAVVAAQLGFWDGELVTAGTAIIARRERSVARLSALARRRFGELARDDGFQLGYRASFPLDALAGRDLINPAEFAGIEAIVRREFEQALLERRVDELRRGATLVGPHREDLTLELNGVDLATYGSRGQQRLALIALKLAEVDLMREASGEPPVLLLDDVLSELDRGHRDLLLAEAVAAGAQLLVSSTDPDLLRAPVLAALPMASVGDGDVRVVDDGTGAAEQPD